MRDEINSGLVGIVSEGTDETIDLAISLAAPGRLRILPTAGAGALQNAEDVMFARGIDIGIIQTDVLDSLRRDPPFSGIEKYLHYITKLYDQDLHILVSKDIHSVKDLAGKKVNVGVRDGGTSTTATSVFDALGVNVAMTNFAQSVALDKLRRGEISGLVYMATKPSRLFHDIRPEENLQFLSITGAPTLLPSYTVTTITAADYPELVRENAPVNTIAVGTVLVAYNWPTKSERHQRVDRFVQAFFGHLDDIKARHPRWRDFDITASVSGWTRYRPAEEWIKKAGWTPQITTASRTDPSRLARSTQASGLDSQQRESLFREFAARESLFREFAAHASERRHQFAANNQNTQ
jgi:TRAP-type uncharacterized transport system substrate-binding protein